MTKTRLATTALAALVTCVTIACKDIPGLPHWDADWNVPLPSQDISLFAVFPGAVPAGASANAGFTPQNQSLDGSVGAILDQDLSNAALVVTLGKTVAVSGTDTVFVAPDSLSLTTGPSTRIVVPFSFLASDLSVTDTVPVNSAGIAMLKSVAQANGTLWIQMRGRVSNPGPGIVTVTPGDSLHVRLSLLATIAVSQ